MSITTLVDKKRVFVAMSGGVDSSVAAALLQKRGFTVIGVYFKPWSDHQNINYCHWQEDRQDALKVALILGIKFQTWDFSKAYGKKVTQYMIGAYRRGLTPNPDVMCNKEIKFGLFLKKALAEGADFIATGHYARLQKSQNSSTNAQANSKQEKSQTTCKLLKGKDKNKDQSYFLWTLTQPQLKHCLFPIGDYTKPEVRKLAQKFDLPNHNKKDSQGVCFIGQLDMKEFLKRHIKPKGGDIILTESEKIIGRHDGAYYYTIGQRHGLDIKTGDGPFYVHSKDLKKNIIYVSRCKNELKASRMAVTNINLIRNNIVFPIDAEVKIRYRTNSLPARITGSGSLKKLAVEFKKPAMAVTAGQSAVFYRGEEVLGGGIIM